MQSVPTFDRSPPARRKFTRIVRRVAIAEAILRIDPKYKRIIAALATMTALVCFAYPSWQRIRAINLLDDRAMLNFESRYGFYENGFGRTQPKHFLSGLIRFVEKRTDQRFLWAGKIIDAHLRIGDGETLFLLTHLENELEWLLIEDGEQLTRGGLESITKLKRLRHLLICSADLDEGDLRILSRIPSLEKVALYECRLRGSMGELLAMCPRIASLHVSDCEFDASAFDEIDRCRQLTDVDLCGSNISDDMVDKLARLPKLEKLNVSATNVTDTSIRSLACSRSLKELRLGGTEVTWDLGGEDLAAADRGGPFPKLRRLDLRGSKISNNSISRLAQLPALEELDLSGTSITWTHANSAEGFRELQRLWLTETLIDDRAIGAILSQAPKLAMLDISETRVGDGGITTLAKCSRLGAIRFRDTLATKKCLDDLRSIKSLRYAETSVLGVLYDIPMCGRESRESMQRRELAAVKTVLGRKPPRNVDIDVCSVFARHW